MDTEPFWQQVEREVFARHGINISPEMQEKATYGLQTREVVMHWYHYQPWDDFAPDELVDEINAKIKKKFKKDAVMMEGVEEILGLFRERGFRIGLASSSSLELIEVFLGRFNLLNRFDVYHTSENENFGKPHPAVYLTTAARLEVRPTECIAFEDSVNGLISAKAARMKTVAIPDASHFNDPGFAIADLKLPSLQKFTVSHLEQLSE